MRPLIFSNLYLPVSLKSSLYKSIIVNLLLWGCENLALQKEFENEISVFHTKCCKAIGGILLWEVAMYRVINENVLQQVEIPPMKEIMHYRWLERMEKIACMLVFGSCTSFLGLGPFAPAELLDLVGEEAWPHVIAAFPPYDTLV